MEKKALGRGLEALLPISGVKTLLEDKEIQELPIEHIIPNRYQPRREFSDSELVELAESVKQNGLLQPILVRRKGDGFFELIVGERRLRAARLAGLHSVAAIVRNSNDEQAIELALVENLQRKDLNPMEAARAYHRMVQEFGFTHETIAQRLGKDRSSIANLVRLVNLPSEIQQLIESNLVSTGHAKVILGLENSEKQVKLARRIAQEQLSVRQAEEEVARESRSRKGKRVAWRRKPYPDLEERIQKHLGTRVTILKGKRSGKVVIHYFSPAELERLLEVLLGGVPISLDTQPNEFK
ncbi:MAG: ParB/RepB/Spo0J family partition protein [Nitrospiraceae bacterium]